MLIHTLAGGYDRNLMYAVGDGTTSVLIDASLGVADVEPAIDRLGAPPSVLVLTHTHGDHRVGLAELLARWPKLVLAAWDRAAEHHAPPGRYRPLAHGEQLVVGGLRFDVRHTPGHSPDGLCLACPPALFTGDTLFIGRTGRTRAPGSDARALYRSLRALDDLPDALVVYPGHDYGPQPSDTLGGQRATNAFLRAGSEDEFLAVMAAYEAGRAS